MKRREFMKFSAVLGATAFANPLFARENFTIYGAPSLPSLTIAVALLQGNLAKNYDAKLQTWRDPDQLRAGVANGTFKVMMSPSNVGLNLANQGQNVGLVNILTNGFTSINGKRKISDLAELKGAKFLIPFKGDMPDIIIHSLFKALKIDPAQIKIEYASSPVQAAELFLKKDYEFAFLPEPMGSACILKGKKMGVKVERCLDLAQTWGDVFGVKPVIPQAGIIANRDFFAAHKGDFEILHTDLINALEWIKSNTQSAAEIGTNLFPAPAPAIAMSLPFSNLVVTKASEIKPELIKFYEVLHEFNPKLIGSKMPRDEFFLC